MYFIPRGGGSRSVLWVPPEHCAECPGTKSSLTRNVLTAAAAEAAVGFLRGGRGACVSPGYFGKVRVSANLEDFCDYPY